MSDDNEITKFQLLAAIIKGDRFYVEFPDAQPYGDVLIEILRRLHSRNDDRHDATDVVDAVFDAIAEEFRSEIGEWDKYGSDVTDADRKPAEGDVLDAVIDAVISTPDGLSRVEFAGRAADAMHATLDAARVSDDTPVGIPTPDQLDIPDGGDHAR